MCQATIDATEEAVPEVITQDDEPSTELPSKDLGNILDEDKNSQRSKLHKSALQHLDIYFREYRKPADPPHDDYKSFKSYKDVLYEDLLSPANNFFGKLANYFAERAVNRRKRSTVGDLLSYTCALNYFSAIKNHYLDEFREKKGSQLACFDERTWKQYQGKIRTYKFQQARENGKKVVDSKEMATEDEQRGLAAICLWNGTIEGINFFCLNKLLLHLGARCCEAAGQWKKDLRYHVIRSDQEWETDEFDVLQFYLDRNKTSTNGQPVIFNHRKTILLDLYFALALQFLLDENDDPCVYPEFHAAVQGKKAGDSLDSKAATLWTQIYKRMAKIVDSFPGKLRV